MLLLPQQGKYRSTHSSVHLPHVCRHQHCQGPCEDPVQFCAADLTDWDRAADGWTPLLHSSWKLLSQWYFKWWTAPAPWVLEAWVPPLSTRTVSRNPIRLSSLTKTATFLKTHFSFTELAATRSFTLTSLRCDTEHSACTKKLKTEHQHVTFLSAFPKHLPNSKFGC